MLDGLGAVGDVELHEAEARALGGGEYRAELLEVACGSNDTVSAGEDGRDEALAEARGGAWMDERRRS